MGVREKEAGFDYHSRRDQGNLIHILAMNPVLRTRGQKGPKNKEH